MKKVISALAVIVSIVLSGPVAAQDIANGVKAYLARDYAVALKEFRVLAEAGDPAGQYLLSLMYIRGEEVIQGLLMAFKGMAHTPTTNLES